MAYFFDWAADALLASFLLALLVLAVRSPVARMFGPRVAYALWLLPALRLVLPPIPALMLPWSESAAPAATHPGVIDTIFIEAAAAAPASAAASGWTDWLLASAPLMLLSLWLAGAAVHLTWQLLAHRKLLSSLRDAEIEGWDAHVRILNSPHVGGPLSLGLLTPMVVMPDDGILALDRHERALAIRHEVMHHRRGDLWANAAAVVFAALHWFNPTMRHIWRAFRFDQEAACDADVLAGADGATRGTYARALAKAASGRPSAFASPMMHANNLKERLAMMTLPPRSTRRRHLGLALAATLTIGLLLATATPRSAIAQEAPAAPARPATPTTPDATATIDLSRDGSDHVTRIVRDDGTTIILHSDRPLDQAAIDRMVAEAEASRAEAERERADGEQADAAGERRREIIMVRHRSDASDADHAAAGDSSGDQNRSERRVMIFRGRDGDGTAHDGHGEGGNGRPMTWRGESSFVIRMGGTPGAGGPQHSCDNDAQAERIERNTDSGDGRHTLRVVMCGMPDTALRLSALRRARESIANMASDHIPPEARTSALAQIDSQIATLSSNSDE